MSGKLLTNISPIIRWIILPFACVLVPCVISGVIWLLMYSQLPFSPEDGAFRMIYYYYIVVKFLQAFSMGFSFSRTTLYLAPTNTRNAMRVTRIIGVSIVILGMGYVCLNNSLDIATIISFLLILFGLLAKFNDEEEMIKSEE